MDKLKGPEFRRTLWIALLPDRMIRNQRSMRANEIVGPHENPFDDSDGSAGALRRSLPARSDEDCQWYLYFSLAILALVVAGSRCLSGFSSSSKKGKDAGMITPRATQFVCIGLNGQSV
jgi:hypothetical protein